MSQRSLGAAHVIDVLRGKSTERIRQLGHDQLTTWGIGKDLDDTQWRVVMRQLIARHVLWVDAEHYNVIRLGGLANDVLRGDMRIEVRRTLMNPPKKDVVAKERRERRDELVAQLSSEGKRIFEALRQWRLETAKSLGKPPYTIFWDKTLVEIARNCPMDEEDLAMIPGVGEQKVERYGDEILDIVAEEIA